MSTEINVLDGIRSDRTKVVESVRGKRYGYQDQQLEQSKELEGEEGQATRINGDRRQVK